MGHRIVKRVPLDFAHPQGVTWPGYLLDAFEVGLCRHCPDCVQGMQGDALCATCDGDNCHPEDRAVFDSWTQPEPPAGDGWQLWETTSEGSPVSPVFATAGELAIWCETGATPFADLRWSRAQWMQSFLNGTTDIDTLLIMRGPERSSP